MEIKIILDGVAASFCRRFGRPGQSAGTRHVWPDFEPCRRTADSVAVQHLVLVSTQRYFESEQEPTESGTKQLQI